MIFKVDAQGSTLELTTPELLNELSVALSKKDPKPEHVELTEGISNYLQSSGLVGELTINKLIYMSFVYGYLYKVFLSQNKVEITHEGDHESTGHEVANSNRD